MATVTAPLVIAKRADGSDVYLYVGTPVPDGLADGELKRLQEAGLVDTEKSASKPAPSKSAPSK